MSAGSTRVYVEVATPALEPEGRAAVSLKAMRAVRTEKICMVMFEPVFVGKRHAGKHERTRN